MLLVPYLAIRLCSDKRNTSSLYRMRTGIQGLVFIQILSASLTTQKSNLKTGFFYKIFIFLFPVHPTTRIEKSLRRKRQKVVRQKMAPKNPEHSDANHPAPNNFISFCFSNSSYTQPSVQDVLMTRHCCN